MSRRMKSQMQMRQPSVLHRPDDCKPLKSRKKANTRTHRCRRGHWPNVSTESTSYRRRRRCRHRHQAAVDGVHLSAESRDESILADGCSLLAAIRQRPTPAPPPPSPPRRCVSIRFGWSNPPTDSAPTHTPLLPHAGRRCTFGGLQPVPIFGLFSETKFGDIWRLCVDTIPTSRPITRSHQ